MSYLKKKDIDDLFNFRLPIPDELADNMEKYIIDLGEDSNNHLECSNCGGIVSKEHPVNKKYNCYNICGFEFERCK